LLGGRHDKGLVIKSTLYAVNKLEITVNKSGLQVPSVGSRPKIRFAFSPPFKASD